MTKINSAELKAFFQTELTEAGCDEAGRGCLAGPVFAAAVILPSDFTHPLLTDSKKLSEKQRYKLRSEIEQSAIAWAVESSDNEYIDQHNILKASVHTMHKAVNKLAIQPGFLIIDGNYFIAMKGFAHKCIVKGDSLYYSIAAASILAKTYRDDYMYNLHNQFPEYNWQKNKGYPTLAHRKAIEQHGITPFHRKSFNLGIGQLKLTF
ncbi:MAG: ribonuclease HII [Bacteroidota bacterium]|nr:ribonuclease HII [Bacteroidota bacterium]